MEIIEVVKDVIHWVFPDPRSLFDVFALGVIIIMFYLQHWSYRKDLRKLEQKVGQAFEEIEREYPQALEDSYKAGYTKGYRDVSGGDCPDPDDLDRKTKEYMENLDEEYKRGRLSGKKRVLDVLRPDKTPAPEMEAYTEWLSSLGSENQDIDVPRNITEGLFAVLEALYVHFQHVGIQIASKEFKFEAWKQDEDRDEVENVNFEIGWLNGEREVFDALKPDEMPIPEMEAYTEWFSDSNQDIDVPRNIAEGLFAVLEVLYSRFQDVEAQIASE